MEEGGPEAMAAAARRAVCCPSLASVYMFMSQR